MSKTGLNFKNGLKDGAFILFSLFLILSFPSRYVYAEWVDVTPPAISANWELFDVKFVTANEGWAVGQDSVNNTGVLLHFTNGAWTSVTLPFVSPDWGLSAVDFISSTEGWAVGQDSFNRTGVILHFSGGSWTPVSVQSVSTDWQLVGIRLISSSQGWAVGKDSANRTGVLLLFSNGVWIPYLPPPSVSSLWGLNDVDFLSAAQGWAVGTDSTSPTVGVLLQFSNSTNLWTRVTPPTVSSNWGLSSLTFVSANEGWAVGKDLSILRGVLLHFLNGAWTSVTPPDDVSADWALGGVDFISSNEGWAVGQDFSNKTGALLHFLNGTWTSFPPPVVTSDWELRSVLLTSSTTGWAVGRASDGTNTRGVLLKYSTPTISVSPTNINFKDIATGAFKNQAVNVGNHGNANLVIGTITSPSPPFSLTDNCSGRTILPQGSCPLTYRFTPTSEGSFTDTSVIPSNDTSRGDVTITLKGNGITGPALFIHLLNPADGEGFTVCTVSTPPTFQWDPSESFKSSEVQFSSQADFSTAPVRAKAKAGTSQLTIPSASWKKVLLLAGVTGGTAYWRVVGTRADGSLVESEIFSLIVEAPQPVSNPTIAPTSKTNPPFPTLSWNNNCNTKFKAWFGNDPDFSKSGVKKKSIPFSVKNPEDNGGQLTKELSSGQWNAIRKVVGDVSGSTIYWYVESSDFLKRAAKTEVGSFILTD